MDLSSPYFLAANRNLTDEQLSLATYASRCEWTELAGYPACPGRLNFVAIRPQVAQHI